LRSELDLPEHNGNKKRFVMNEQTAAKVYAIPGSVCGRQTGRTRRSWEI